jgi:ABC-2 type transport system permease protein
VSIPNDLRFAAALIGTNLKASFAQRGAFLLQATLMLLNNIIFFAIWWIFFDRFDEVRGWRIGDVMALYGVVACAFGCSVVLAGGVRELARVIADGELDVFLTQPKPALLHAVGSHTFAAGWGDLASGIFFLCASGVVAPTQLPVAIVAVALSTIVFLSSGIIIHSATFWVGRMDSLARQVWEFLLTFSMYPQPLFTGPLRLLLFSLVPAGFVGYLPVSLLRDFSLVGLAAAIAGAVVYGSLAVWVFGRGLRRYSSGSRFGVRV